MCDLEWLPSSWECFASPESRRKGSGDRLPHAQAPANTRAAFAGPSCQFSHPCGVTFVKAKSYEGVTSNKRPKEILGLDVDIKNRTVIVLEDIIDTGITISEIVDRLMEKEPLKIKVATLFFKRDVFNKKVNIDYIGIEIPDDFVVGFGMDYNGLGRNLKDVYTIN